MSRWRSGGMSTTTRMVIRMVHGVGCSNEVRRVCESVQDMTITPSLFVQFTSVNIREGSDSTCMGYLMYSITYPQLTKTCK